MTTQPHSGIRDLFLILFGAVCISFAPVFVKLIGPDKIGPTAIGFWRLLIGSAILIGVTLVQRHPLTLPRTALPYAALAGLMFAGDMFLWIRSIFYCGSGMATILSNTQVFASAVLSYFVFNERLTMKFFVAAVSAFLGVALLVGLGSGSVVFTERYVLGILLGLASGLAYANYLIVLKKAGHHPDLSTTVTLIAWSSAFSALFLGISAAIERTTVLPPDLRTWLCLIGAGIVAQTLGWLAIAASLPRLAASRAGLALLLQPTLAAVWGFLWFSEQLTAMQILGAVITLTAIYFGSVRR
jgi:drug/metabolite transporter (DMT)-like permease